MPQFLFFIFAKFDSKFSKAYSNNAFVSFTRYKCNITFCNLQIFL